MAQPYFNALEELVVRELPGIPGLVCKHFFSGPALYSNMKICASLTSSGFAFKLSEQRCSELIASEKAVPLRFFEKSPVKKGYVLLPHTINPSNALVVSYLKECLAYVNSQNA